MEKSEPTFIPEWLKGGSGGSATSHQMVRSSLHSDDQIAAKTTRNNAAPGINDNGIGHSFVSDRITSPYFRRSSSSNGSSNSRSHGTFGRNNRERDWDRDTVDTREKGTHFLSDHRREYSDPSGTFLRRFDNDLRRSQSMVTAKLGEPLLRKMPSYPSNTNKSSGLQSGVSALSNVHKTSFERNFPSLGAEEKQGSEIRRVSSPGLGSAMSLGASALTRGDMWTSALAEVPVVATSNEIGSIQQVKTLGSVPMASSLMTGLNMAETVAQGSSRAQTPPELSGGTQRLEELAIRQSKQLIPVTPSMPKAVVLNSSDKQKAKLGLQQTSSPTHSPRSAPVTPELLKLPSVGKLQILKPVRERNGIVPSSKDTSNPTSGNKGLPNSPLALKSASSKGPIEKKLTPQAQSRNDFFNLMRKKSVVSPSSTSTNSPDLSHDGDSPVSGTFFVDESSKGSDEKCNEIFPEKPMESSEDKVFVSVSNVNDRSSFSAIVPSEEEEAAFLRSLGWEENGGEDEGLTEEEISSFLNEYIKLKPPQAMQPKVLETLSLRIGNIGGGGASFGSSLSDSKSPS